jgi:hypothetical protein
MLRLLLKLSLDRRVLSSFRRRVVKQLCCDDASGVLVLGAVGAGCTLLLRQMKCKAVNNYCRAYAVAGCMLGLQYSITN